MTEEEHYMDRQAAIADEQQREEWEAAAKLLPTVVEPKPQSIVRAAVGDMTEAFAEYKRIQTQLDRLLPDCIQNIQGKKFRKKSYWRAIATAFNLQLACTKEERDLEEGGWLITYRATAPNGRFADGDGSCYEAEKRSGQGTVHNVRAHAHTRAMNRAISNLVGFGEVSAEEVHYESAGREEPKAHGASSARPASGASPAASRPANNDPGPQPLTSDMEMLPYLGDKLGFGKHSDKTWKFFCEGAIDSGRIDYLRYLTRDGVKGRNAERAHEIITLVERREEARQKAINEQPAEEAF